MPPHVNYVEPFGGSAGVLLNKTRSRIEVYNDVYGDVVNFFKVLRDHGDELRRLIEFTPYAREEHSRSCDPCDCPIERARRFAVRQYMSFRPNGDIEAGFLWHGRQGNNYALYWSNYPDGMPSLAERLQGVFIENLDYKDIFEKWDDEETLFFIDPPYAPETRDGQTFYENEFSNEDHIEMLELVKSLKAKVMLCGYESELYSNYFAEWNKEKKSNTAFTNGKRIECLWMNYEPQGYLNLGEEL